MVRLLCCGRWLSIAGCSQTKRLIEAKDDFAGHGRVIEHNDGISAEFISRFHCAKHMESSFRSEFLLHSLSVTPNFDVGLSVSQSAIQHPRVSGDYFAGHAGPASARPSEWVDGEK